MGEHCGFLLHLPEPVFRPPCRQGSWAQPTSSRSEMIELRVQEAMVAHVFRAEYQTGGHSEQLMHVRKLPESMERTTLQN